MFSPSLGHWGWGPQQVSAIVTGLTPVYGTWEFLRDFPGRESEDLPTEGDTEAGRHHTLHSSSCTFKSSERRRQSEMGPVRAEQKRAGSLANRLEKPENAPPFPGGTDQGHVPLQGTPKQCQCSGFGQQAWLRDMSAPPGARGVRVPPWDRAESETKGVGAEPQAKRTGLGVGGTVRGWLDTWGRDRVREEGGLTAGRQNSP